MDPIIEAASFTVIGLVFGAGLTTLGSWVTARTTVAGQRAVARDADLRAAKTLELVHVRDWVSKRPGLYRAMSIAADLGNREGADRVLAELQSESHLDDSIYLGADDQALYESLKVFITTDGTHVEMMATLIHEQRWAELHDALSKTAPWLRKSVTAIHTQAKDYIFRL